MKLGQVQCQALGKRNVRCMKNATKFQESPFLALCTQHWGYYIKGYDLFVEQEGKRVIVTLTTYEGKHK